MTLSVSLPVVESVVLDDVLEFTHTTLDQKCVSIWTVLWPKLLSAASDKTQVSEIPVLVLRKLIYNYGNTHQLHRLVSKFLEALRNFTAIDSLPPTVPYVLYQELCRVLGDGSEQQMVNIFAVLLKEGGIYIEDLEANVNDLSIYKLKILSQLVWILLQQIRIRNTTRQEIVQNLCRQYLELRETIVDRLLILSKVSSYPDLIYISLLLGHSWCYFPVIFKDRLDLPLNDSAKLTKKYIKTFQESVRISGRPDLRYWMHLIFLQSYVMRDSAVSSTFTQVDDFFCWDILDPAKLHKCCEWNGNPFEITADNVTVALWQSVSTNYFFLPPNIINEQSDHAAKFLVESLVVSELASDRWLTVQTISEALISSGKPSSCPAFHAACLKILEAKLKSTLDTPREKVVQKKAKRTKLNEHQNDSTCDILCRILYLIRKLKFTVDPQVPISFSFSLVWKSVKFILTHRRVWSDVPEDLNSVPSLEKLLMTAILTIPAKDAKFYESILLDLEVLRSKFCAQAFQSKNPQVLDVLLDSLYCHEFQLLLLISGYGEMTGLTDVLNVSKSLRGVDLTHLQPVVLDVVLQRLNLPKAMTVYDDVILIVMILFESLSTLVFSSDESVILPEKLKLFCTCTSSVLSTVKKLRSIETYKKRLDTLMEIVSSTVTKERTSQAIDRAQQSDNALEVQASLRFISLSLEVTQTCRSKQMRKIIRLLMPAADVEMPGCDEDGDVVDDLSENLDDGQLIALLQSQIKNIKITATMIPGQSKEVSAVSASEDYRTMFGRMMQYSKPDKLAGLCLEIASEDVFSRADPLTELRFCRLIASNNPSAMTTPAWRPVFAMLLTRISGIISRHMDNRNVSIAVMELLHTLMRGPYAMDASLIALSDPIYQQLLQKGQSDADFTSYFEFCSGILNVILTNPRLVSTRTIPSFMKATSLWLVSILQRARQENDTTSVSSRKAIMIRNASFVERLLGNVAKHQRFFSKLVIHLIAVYCSEMQNGTLYPEAKEHITAGLYRLLDIIDPHSKQMGNATISTESREIYKNLLDDHTKYHKYRGLV